MVKDNPGKVYYFHLRFKTDEDVIHNRGGVTLGITYDKDEEIYKYAVAFCSMKDNYSRKIGRGIVNGRIVDNKYNTLRIEENTDTKAFLQNFIDAIFPHNNTVRLANDIFLVAKPMTKDYWAYNVVDYFYDEYLGDSLELVTSKKKSSFIKFEYDTFDVKITKT